MAAVIVDPSGPSATIFPGENTLEAKRQRILAELAADNAAAAAAPAVSAASASASAASASAAAASVSADAAEAAQLSADAAVAAAEAAGAPTYASTAAGIAATTNGQAFSVDNGDGTVSIYRNNAGSAVLQRQMPTVAYFSVPAGGTRVAYKSSVPSSVARNVQSKLDDFESIKDIGAVGNGIANDTPAVAAALSNSRIVELLTGDYAITSGFYDNLNCRFHGKGRLVIAGKAQARDRAFITNEIVGIDDSNSYEGFFDGDWSKQFRTCYSFVGPSVGSTAITSYRHLVRAAQDVHVMVFTGGKNTANNDQAGGRTGVWREMSYLTHGGQGDFGATFYRLACYSTRDGLHWLAEPALSTQAYDFDTLPGAKGPYQQRSEINHYDYNDGTTQIGINVHTDTVNFTRNSNVESRYQGWWFLRTQSRGTYAVDGVISPSGAHKRIIDSSATELGSDGALLAMKSGQYVYLDVIEAPDPRGIKRLSTLTETRFGYDAIAGAVVTKLATGKKVGVQNAEGTFLADPTAWKTPTLSNSWAAYTVQGQSVPKYRRNTAGQLVLKGQASGGAANTAAFTLPVGYRPPERLYFITNSVMGQVLLTVDSDGVVFILNPADNAGTKFFSLDGIIIDLQG